MKPFCPRGHPRTPENLRPRRADCAVCHREDERARHEANLEESRARAREYARAHKEEAAVRSRAWKAANVEHVREVARRRRWKRAEGSVEYVEILRRDPCAYCGEPCEWIDHIEPVAHGGTNAWGNLTASCRRCNQSKSTRPLLKALLVLS